MALNYSSAADTELQHGEAPQRSDLKAGPFLRLSEASETDNGDTGNDLSDMKRLGKKQEFKVIYIHRNSTTLPTYVKVNVRAAEFWLFISWNISMADSCTAHSAWD